MEHLELALLEEGLQPGDLVRRDAAAGQGRRVEPEPLAEIRRGRLLAGFGAGAAGRRRCAGGRVLVAGRGLERRPAPVVVQHHAQHLDLALETEPRVALGRELLLERCQAGFDRRSGRRGDRLRRAGRVQIQSPPQSAAKTAIAPIEIQRGFIARTIVRAREGAHTSVARYIRHAEGP